MSEISKKRVHEDEKDVEEDLEPKTKKDKLDDVTVEQEKPEIVKKAEKVKSLKSPPNDEMESEFTHVLNELSKQKDTIKKLLDDLRADNKKRKTHNIRTIFQKKD